MLTDVLLMLLACTSSCRFGLCMPVHQLDGSKCLIGLVTAALIGCINPIDIAAMAIKNVFMLFDLRFVNSVCENGLYVCVCIRIRISHLNIALSLHYTFFAGVQFYRFVVYVQRYISIGMRNNLYFRGRDTYFHVVSFKCYSECIFIPLLWNDRVEV